MKQLRWLAPLLVLTVAICIVRFDLAPRHRYTADGLVYARMTALDAGLPLRDAVLGARGFYERSDLGKNTRYRSLLEISVTDAIPKSSVFANRLLYPFLASRLFGIAGFGALWIVSSIAYVASALALYCILLYWGRPAFAAALTIATMLLPAVRAFGASDLTDMLAWLCWLCVLGSTLYYVRSKDARWLIGVAFAAIALALTRPAPFLPPLCALAVGIAWWKNVALRGPALQLFAASLAGVLAYGADVLIGHGYGLGAQVQWLYLHDVPGGQILFAHWYATMLSHALATESADAVRSIVALPLLAFAVYGVAKLPRYRAELALVLGGACGCLVVIFLEHAFDVSRVINFPMLPLLAITALCALDSLMFSESTESVKESVRGPSVQTAP